MTTIEDAVRDLQDKIGYPFVITELSPDNRKVVMYYKDTLTHRDILLQSMMELEEQKQKSEMQVGWIVGCSIVLLSCLFLYFIIYFPEFVFIVYIIAFICACLSGWVVIDYFIVESKLGKAQREYSDYWETVHRYKDIAMQAINTELSQIFNQKKNPTIKGELVHSGTIKHVTIDFNDIFNRFKDVGISLEQIKCPNCGGPIHLPHGGDIVACPYCHGSYRATDIMEIINKLVEI